MKINNKTELYLTASSMPSNFGVTIYNELFSIYSLNKLYMGRSILDAKKLIDTIKFLDIKGCSVSMPLKNEVIDYLDEIEESAKKVSSVNTIVNENGILKGFNTDIIGFQKSLKNYKFKYVLIYGTGSVVDSLVYVLKQMGCKIYLLARDNKKVEAKAKKLSIEVYKDKEFDLFVNATPLSLAPLSDDIKNIVLKSTVIYDLIVKQNTYLKTFAESKDKQFISGFEMYKYQFLKQFQYYTQIEVDVDVVEKIAKENLLI